MKKINKKGFTLTELIVVIAVIAILAAVLIPTLTGYIEKARISADNQEVAVLNKLLLGAQIDEIEFENVPQLKKYLEEEMDYDGDYSLGVKGNYLWYNKEKYEFVIVKENEVTGVYNVAGDYKWAKNAKSPEELLYIDDNPLWLVGGKGSLVEFVDSIRNVGNTGSSKNIEIPADLNENIKSALDYLFDEFVFSGTSGHFIINKETGAVTLATAEDNNKKLISANGASSGYKIDELRQLFNNNVIKANLDSINEDLKSKGNKVQLELSEVNGEYKVNVKILDNGLREIIPVVLDVIKLLSSSGCTSAYIIPVQFETVEKYCEVFTSIKETPTLRTAELAEFQGTFIQNLLDLGYTLEQTADLNSYMWLDLETFKGLEDLNPGDLFGVIPPLFIALNLYKNGDLYDIHDSQFEANIDLLKNKNEIRIISSINSDIYGYFDIQYDFKFDFSAFSTN